MIHLRSGKTALIGLTDVNLRRMQEGKPIELDLVTLPGTAGARIPAPDKVVVFYASRETIVKLADTSGLDVVELLNALGEG